ncbi:TVP38/TMEM64 family protein [Halobacillus fulvus]|nr:TVP38/TMEM64 family protein [Halobacillus fulvus]
MDRKTWIRFILITLFLSTAVYFVHFRWAISATDLRTFILSFGMLSPLVFFIMYGLGPVIFFPSSILSITAGLTYGLWPGFLYIWIGALGASLSGYGLAYFFGESILKLNQSEKVRKIRSQIEVRGFIYVLVLRLIPLVGFHVLSYSAGIVKVKLRDYMGATALGIIPAAFAYGLVGSSFHSGKWFYILIAFIPITTLVLMSYFFRSRVRVWLGMEQKDKSR